MEGNKITLILDESNEVEIQGYLVEILEEQKKAILELDSNQLEGENIIGKCVQLSVLNDQQGVLLYKGVVHYFLKHRLHIEQLEFLNKVQRRNDVKVSVDYIDDIELISKETVTQFAVRFKDISAGGLCFEVCEELPDLQEGDLISTIFKQGRFPVILEMKILRISHINHQLYIYGCQFVEMSPEVESLIREFVFRAQVEKKKKTIKEIGKK